jgi:hypothetical protein
MAVYVVDIPLTRRLGTLQPDAATSCKPFDSPPGWSWTTGTSVDDETMARIKSAASPVLRPRSDCEPWTFDREVVLKRLLRSSHGLRWVLDGQGSESLVILIDPCVWDVCSIVGGEQIRNGPVVTSIRRRRLSARAQIRSLSTPSMSCKTRSSRQTGSSSTARRDLKRCGPCRSIRRIRKLKTCSIEPECR